MSLKNPSQPWLKPHEIDPFLADVRRRYMAGDKRQLLFAIYTCGLHKVEIPDWAMARFAWGFDRVVECLAASWDDVFGRPLPKGKSLAAARKRFVLRSDVWYAVCDLHGNSGLPIDEHLFQLVGKKFEISGSTARDYFYQHDRELVEEGSPLVTTSAGSKRRGRKRKNTKNR